MKKQKKINSVGVILDGNRRWAVENGLAKIEGHYYGAKNVEKLISWCQDEKIENLVLYVFSTENWKRTKREVQALVILLEKWLLEKVDYFHKQDVAIKFIGSIEKFPSRVEKLMKAAEEKTKHNKTKVFLATSYGGRLEILEAIKKLSQELNQKEIQKLSEADFEKYLWSADLPDPEIIIRTGGDKRLSNFLAWKSTYSEIIFTDTKWPAFSKKEFKNILQNYLEQTKINKGK